MTLPIPLSPWFWIWLVRPLMSVQAAALSG
jgi:hypothetical protein